MKRPILRQAVLAALALVSAEGKSFAGDKILSPDAAEHRVEIKDNGRRLVQDWKEGGVLSTAWIFYGTSDEQSGILVVNCGGPRYVMMTSRDAVQSRTVITRNDRLSPTEGTIRDFKSVDPRENTSNAGMVRAAEVCNGPVPDNDKIKQLMLARFPAREDVSGKQAAMNSDPSP